MSNKWVVTVKQDSRMCTKIQNAFYWRIVLFRTRRIDWCSRCYTSTYTFWDNRFNKIDVSRSKENPVIEDCRIVPYDSIAWRFWPKRMSYWRLRLSSLTEVHYSRNSFVCYFTVYDFFYNNLLKIWHYCLLPSGLAKHKQTAVRQHESQSVFISSHFKYGKSRNWTLPLETNNLIVCKHFF